MTTNHPALEDPRKTGAPIVKARVVETGILFRAQEELGWVWTSRCGSSRGTLDPLPPLLLKTGLRTSGLTRCGGAQRVELTRA
jgi:hypothetical protein